MSLESDAEISRLISTTLQTIGLAELVYTFHWRWNARFRSSLGRADYSLLCVELSSALWPLVSVPIRRSTVIHEVCHIGSFKLYGCGGHGIEWQQLMIDCGEDPSPRHSFGKHLNKVQVFCDCEDGCRVGKITHHKIAHGKASYACNRCNRILRLVK
jgi:predicted SprT family Zn-dependent metalloprotease